MQRLIALVRAGSDLSLGAGALAGCGAGAATIKLSSALDVSVIGGFSLGTVCAGRA